MSMLDRSSRTSFCPKAELWLLLSVAAVTFLLLGNRGLIEPDEGRYAEMAREMAVNRDFLIPTLNGFAHFQKPPMIYWLTAACIKCFGSNPWAVRLPSAFAGVGTVYLTLLIGRMLFGARAGMAASVVLATSLEFFLLSRALTPDMLLTFWVTASIAAFVRWALKPEKAQWIWISFAAMGCGFLTKGPMAIVVPVSAMVSWHLGNRHAESRPRMPWIRGMLIALMIGLSWFIVIAARNPDLFHYFLYDELFARFATDHHGRNRPFYFFALILLGGLMPWTVFVPALLRWLYRERSRLLRTAPDWWLVCGWFLVPFIILSASSSKLLTYVLPLYPAVALALGAWFQENAETRGIQKEIGAIAILYGFMVFLLIVTVKNKILPLPLSGAFFTALVLAVLVIGASLVPPKMPSAKRGLIIGGATMALWLLILTQADACNDIFGRQAAIHSLVPHIQKRASQEPIVFAYGVNAPSLEFYLNRCIPISRAQADAFFPPTPNQSARLLGKPSDCLRLRIPGRPLIGLVLAERIDKDFPLNDWRLIAKAGDFALIEFIPRDGAVLSTRRALHIRHRRSCGT